MADVEEDNQHSLKRYEELYSFAKSDFANEDKAYDAVEAKAGRYLTAWAIINGLNALGAKDFVNFLSATKGAIDYIYITLCSLFVLVAMASLFCLFQSINVEYIKGWPVVNNETNRAPPHL